MQIINNLLIPLAIIYILGYGLFKKNSIYDSFLLGAKEGLVMTYKIVPSLLAMVVAINIFTNSGVLDYIINSIAFFSDAIKAIIPMALMRPISGSASLAILSDILGKFGPDSFTGRLASTIQGCTDTTMYIIALYFGSIRITKTKYALLVGLFADFIGILSSIFIVYLLFN